MRSPRGRRSQTSDEAKRTDTNRAAAVAARVSTAVAPNRGALVRDRIDRILRGSRWLRGFSRRRYLGSDCRSRWSRGYSRKRYLDSLPSSGSCAKPGGVLIEPGLRVVTAPNPGFMTADGTN